MKKSHQLVRDIQQYCAAHADAKAARRYERYFKEGYDAWGLLDKGNPFFTERRDEWLARYADIGVAGFVEAGEKLFASGKYEEGALAIRFLVSRLPEMDAAAALSLARWFEAGVRNWAHTDVLCGELLAPMLRDGRLPVEALAPWRASPLRFQRRAVPVSMLGLLPPLAKGDVLSPAGRRKVKGLLVFLRPMMLDGERVVHQGLGWFLREAWKKDPADVEAFLLPFKDTAARLIFQYATEKMTAAGKERFRSARVRGGRSTKKR
jgi:3-methyladenine DNA glycosylase AlkD